MKECCKKVANPLVTLVYKFCPECGSPLEERDAVERITGVYHHDKVEEKKPELPRKFENPYLEGEKKINEIIDCVKYLMEKGG